MSGYRKSVPRPAQAGAGAPSPKNGKITVIYAEDILSFPERDLGGVKLVGNIVLKSGAKMHYLYMTPTSQKLNDEITGDEDMEAFTKKAEGIHPGDSLDIREFRANALGVPFVLIFGAGCGKNTGDVIGTPCNPVKLKGSYASDNEGIKNVMMFDAVLPDREPIGLYSGETTFAENFIAADEDLALTVANGVVQELPAFALAEVLTATAIDLDNGAVVSLIGGGGADPATLDVGVQGVVTVILLNGTVWTALKGAVINLEVIKGGATTYLVEKSRA